VLKVPLPAAAAPGDLLEELRKTLTELGSEEPATANLPGLS
jgi:hypothetical protein